MRVDNSWDQALPPITFGAVPIASTGEALEATGCAVITFPSFVPPTLLSQVLVAETDVVSPPPWTRKKQVACALG